MRRGHALLLVLLLGGCAGMGIRSDEIPTGEIALRWYDEKGTRKRREAVADLTGLAKGWVLISFARVQGLLLACQAESLHRARDRRLTDRNPGVAIEQVPQLH